jgi:hypothetical protein
VIKSPLPRRQQLTICVLDVVDTSHWFPICVAAVMMLSK